jgi:hypothetical protein
MVGLSGRMGMIFLLGFCMGGLSLLRRYLLLQPVLLLVETR